MRRYFKTTHLITSCSYGIVQVCLVLLSPFADVSSELLQLVDFSYNVVIWLLPMQVYVDKLVKVAYENWENVVEYDGEALIGIKPYKLRGIDAHTEDPINGHTLGGHQPQTSVSSQHSGPAHSMAMQRSLTGSVHELSQMPWLLMCKLMNRM